MVDPFISVLVVTLKLTIIWLVNGFPDIRVIENAVECNLLNSRFGKKSPCSATILSRVARLGTDTVQYRLGTDTVQYKKPEPDVISQVNKTRPPGQTDTIPNEDSVIDAPIYEY